MNETFITKSLFSKNISKQAEWDVNVPDNRPDVLKILYFTTDCHITEKNISNKELTVQITVLADILYIPENSDEKEICALHTQEHFTIKSDLPQNMSFDLCDIKLNQNFSNCVILNSRKIGIRTECTLNTEFFVDMLLPDFSQNSQFVFDEKNFEASYICTVKNDSIPFSEHFSVPPSKSGINEILYFKTTVENKEIKGITNKGVLKGDIKLEILYLSENDTIEHLEFFSPFTEIIDIEGMSEDFEIIFDVYTKMPGLKNDQNGKITLDGTIVADIKAFTKKISSYVCDAYCPTYEETVTKENLSYVTYSSCISDRYNMKEVFCFDDFEISEVLFVNPKATVTNVKINENNILINTRFLCDVIYRTNGAIRCDQKTKEFEFVCDKKENENYNNAEITCEVTDFSFVIQGQNCLEIRCNVNFKTFLYEKKDIVFVNCAENDQSKKKKQNRPAIVAYYPKKDERVFDICKKYNSYPDNIRFINSLGESDVCKKGSCVIIE